MNINRALKKLAGRLGIKKMLLPVYDFIYRGKNHELMSKYDKKSTAYGLNKEKRNFELTVSFTTFPARIGAAAYVADAMLRQTLKPDRIILALAYEEFASKKDLPDEYEALEKRGLTIVFVENLRPHNKYYFAMSNYPNSIVITVDDDVLYPDDVLETLYHSYKMHPHAVSAMRAHRILFQDRALLPYNRWEFESTYSAKPELDLFATGVGGALYPPGCMHEDLLDEKLIKWLSPDNDDIWLKFMQLKSRTPVALAVNKRIKLLYLPGSQKAALSSKNVDKSLNDRYIKNCMDYLQLTPDGLFDMIKA